MNTEFLPLHLVDRELDEDTKNFYNKKYFHNEAIFAVIGGVFHGLYVWDDKNKKIVKKQKS